MSYLKKMLEEKHMTQAELGRRIGKSRSYICAIASNRVKLKNLDTMCDMAVALGIDFGEFAKGIINDR